MAYSVPQREIYDEVPLPPVSDEKGRREVLAKLENKVVLVKEEHQGDVFWKGLFTLDSNDLDLCYIQWTNSDYLNLIQGKKKKKDQEEVHSTRLHVHDLHSIMVQATY